MGRVAETFARQVNEAQGDAQRQIALLNAYVQKKDPTWANYKLECLKALLEPGARALIDGNFVYKPELRAPSPIPWFGTQPQAAAPPKAPSNLEDADIAFRWQVVTLQPNHWRTSYELAKTLMQAHQVIEAVPFARRAWLQVAAHRDKLVADAVAAARACGYRKPTNVQLRLAWDLDAEYQEIKTWVRKVYIQAMGQLPVLCRTPVAQQLHALPELVQCCYEFMHWTEAHDAQERNHARFKKPDIFAMPDFIGLLRDAAREFPEHAYAFWRATAADVTYHNDIAATCPSDQRPAEATRFAHMAANLHALGKMDEAYNVMHMALRLDTRNPAIEAQYRGYVDERLAQVGPYHRDQKIMVWVNAALRFFPQDPAWLALKAQHGAAAALQDRKDAEIARRREALVRLRQAESIPGQACIRRNIPLRLRRDPEETHRIEVPHATDPFGVGYTWKVTVEYNFHEDLYYQYYEDRLGKITSKLETKLPMTLNDPGTLGALQTRAYIWELYRIRTGGTDPRGPLFYARELGKCDGTININNRRDYFTDDVVIPGTNVTFSYEAMRLQGHDEEDFAMRAKIYDEPIYGRDMEAIAADVEAWAAGLP